MPISQDAFAKKMMTALRRAGSPPDLRYDADRFAIVHSSLGELFLHSVHQSYTHVVLEARFSAPAARSGDGPDADSIDSDGL
jgi:hypothetical protein